MKPTETFHIYGQTVIPSRICERCKIDAFIIDGQMSCCGFSVSEREESRFKIEIDKPCSQRRRGPSGKLRRKILEDQDGQCFYCGDRFGSFRKLDCKRKMVKLTWDHVVPFAWDGNNQEFVGACAECNATKGSLHFGSLDEAKIYLQSRIYERKAHTRSTALRKLRRTIHAETKMG